MLVFLPNNRVKKHECGLGYVSVFYFMIFAALGNIAITQLMPQFSGLSKLKTFKTT